MASSTGLKILTLLKWVPSISQDLTINENGKSIKTEGLVYELNEYDNYALEEALRLKEEHINSNVTVLTVGSVSSQEALYIGLAKGADEAIHILCETSELDAWATADILAKLINTISIDYDLILTGLESVDAKEGQVGVLLAEKLHLPHVSAVINIEIKNRNATVNRELGGGVVETLEIPLPAVFSIMSSKNPPRYASITRIRMARRKQVRFLVLKDIDLSDEQIRPKIKILNLVTPKREKSVEIITGETVQDVAKTLIKALMEKGVL